MSAPVHAIAEVQPFEAPIVAALHGETVGAAGGPGERWDAAFVARLLALPGAFAFVAGPAAPEDLPAGFALCLPAGEAVDIAAIGVRAAQRRGGIGRGLIAASAARARRMGAARLMLEVAADNATALGFYEALGFARVGRRPNYYGGAPARPARDALVLSKTL